MARSLRRLGVAGIALALVASGCSGNPRNGADVDDPHRGAEAIAKAVGKDPIYEIAVSSSSRRVLSINAKVRRGQDVFDLRWTEGDKVETSKDDLAFAYAIESSPLRADVATIDKMLAAAIRVEGAKRGNATAIALPNGKILRAETGNEGTFYSVDEAPLWEGVKEERALTAARDLTAAVGAPPQWDWFVVDRKETGGRTGAGLTMTVLTQMESTGLDGKPCPIAFHFFQRYGAAISCMRQFERKYAPTTAFRDDVFAQLRVKAGPTDRIEANVEEDGAVVWTVAQKKFDAAGKPKT